MTAYELSDQLIECITDGSTDLVCVEQAAQIIRQQADRIAELEKQGKPVAWMQMHHKDNIPTKFSHVKVWEDDIPLYTTPQTKPLSDEEVFNLTAWKKNPYELYVEMEKEDMIAFARAIEERHGIK